MLAFWLKYAGQEISAALPAIAGNDDDDGDEDDDYDDYDDDEYDDEEDDEEDDDEEVDEGESEGDPFEEPRGEERIEVMEIGGSPRAKDSRFLASIRGGGLPPRVAARKERWELVFAIAIADDDQRFGRNLGTGPEPRLYKALRYVKKTGESGRVKAWAENCLTEELDASSAQIARRFASLEENSVALAQVADLIFESETGKPPATGAREIPLYLLDQNRSTTYVPLAVVKFESLAVSFMLKSYDPRSGRVGFMPVHAFVPEAAAAGAPAPGSRSAALWAGFAGPRLLLVYPAGILAWTDRPEFLSLPAARFLGYDAGLAREEIVEAAQTLGGIVGDRLTIELPPSRLERKIARPRVGLDLDFDREVGLVAARLRFLYDEHEAKGNESGFVVVAEGTIRVVERDLSFEDRVRRRLREMLEVEKIESWRVNYLRTSMEADFFFRAQKSRFLLEGLGELVDKGIVVRVSGIEGEFRGRTKISAGISTAGDWFEMRASGSADGADFDIPDLAAAIERGFASSGGRLFLLSAAERERFAALMDRWDSDARSFRIDAADFGRLELAAELADASRTAKKDREALAARLDIAKRLRGLDRLKSEPLPAGFSGELRPYQKSGYDRLCFFEREGLSLLLADDMGLGKTIQTLVFLLRLKEREILGPCIPKKKGRKPALLVAPVTLLHNWEDEARKFAPGLVILRHHGTGRAKEPGPFGSADIVSTSYQTLRADLELFKKMSFSIFVMDEGHNIKNPDSAAFAAVKAIDTERRLSLTGTPVENRPLELWSQFEFLSPGFLGSRAAFERRFGRPIAGGTKAAAPASALLKRLASPFILRRRKEEVLTELPPKEELVRRLDMGPKQAAVYEKLRQAAAERVRSALRERGSGRSAIAVFEALLRLRQAAIHPGLVDPSFEKAGSAKLDFLAESMEELRAEGHRVLVFSQFVQVLKRAQVELDRLGISHEYLDGQTRDRRERIASFKSGESTAFLLSLKAGGAGINLPEADYVILLDPWWNPAVESQAIDRAHRIGQSRKVTVLKPIAAGTVEEKMLELQERKKAMVRDLVAEDGAFYASLSETEIMNLFEA